MFTLIKWLFSTLILLLAIAIAVPVAATYLIEQDEMKTRISSWVMENTGRNFTIHGDVGFEPGLELRLYVDDAELQNPSWASRPLALSSERAELTIELLPLFQKQIVVNSLTLTGANLWVQNHETEGSNLKLITSKKPPGQAPTPVPSWFGIKRINIENSKILSAAQTSDRITTIDLFEAELIADQLEEPFRIEARGAVNGLPVDLVGSASTLGTLLARKPTETELTLTSSSGDRVFAAGTISDMLFWRGIEARTEFSFPSIPNLAPLFSNRPLDIRALNGSATFNQPGTVSSMSLNNINGVFEYLDLEFNLAGRIGKLSSLDQLSLEISSDQEFDFSQLVPSVSSKNGEPLSSTLAATFFLSGSTQETKIDIQEFDFALGDIIAHAKGGFVIEKGDWSAPLEVDLSVPDLAAAGERFNLSLPDVGPMRLSGLLARADQKFDLSEVHIKNFSDNVSFTAEGVLSNVGKDTSGSLNFDANASPDFYKQDYFSLPIEPSSTEVSGIVKIEEGRLPVNLQSISVILPGGSITGSGSVSNLSSLGDVEIDLDAEVRDWPALAKAIDVSMPDFGETTGSAVLKGKIGGQFDLSDIVAESVSLPDLVNLNGDLQQIGKEMAGEIDFELKLPQARVVEIFPGLEFANDFLSDAEEVNASGKLTRSKQGLWSVDELVAQSRLLGAALKVDGKLSQMSLPTGVLSVSILGEVNQNDFPSNSVIPPFDSIDLNFKVPIDSGSLTVENLKGRITGQQGRLELQSDKAFLKDGTVGAFAANVQVPDIKKALPTVKVFRDGISLEADLVIVLKDKQWQVESTLNSGESDFDGTITYDFSKSRPKLMIRGVSESLNVDELLLPGPKEERFFSEKSMLPEWMSQFDGEIDIEAGRFINNSFDFDHFDSLVKFEQENVSVRLSAQRGEGSLNSSINFPVDANSRIIVVTNELPVTAFRALTKREIFQGGALNINANLIGPGRNLAGILAGGNGFVGLDINDSAIKGAALDNVGGDIFSNLLRIFNPFVKKDKLVNVECAAIRFDVVGGKAVTRNGLAMKTDRVTLLGSGEISIKNEGLKLEIAPKPRKGFGISASSFAKMIRLGGTLSDPDVEASATGFFKSGAAIGAAFFTGGLSLIGQGLLDRLKANEDVCAIAKGEVQIETRVIDDIRGR